VSVEVLCTTRTSKLCKLNRGMLRYIRYSIYISTAEKQARFLAVIFTPLLLNAKLGVVAISSFVAIH
jgi:hypothetical protein